MLLALRDTEGKKCIASVTTRCASHVGIHLAADDHAVPIPDQFMTTLHPATNASGG
jgi:hypothetical protein